MKLLQWIRQRCWKETIFVGKTASFKATSVDKTALLKETVFVGKTASFKATSMDKTALFERDDLRG